jgi:hypothetical protein
VTEFWVVHTEEKGFIEAVGASLSILNWTGVVENPSVPKVSFAAPHAHLWLVMVWGLDKV